MSETNGNGGYREPSPESLTAIRIGLAAIGTVRTKRNARGTWFASAGGGGDGADWVAAKHEIGEEQALRRLWDACGLVLANRRARLRRESESRAAAKAKGGVR